MLRRDNDLLKGDLEAAREDRDLKFEEADRLSREIYKQENYAFKLRIEIATLKAEFKET
jgi:hypothetical protein